MSGTAIIHYLLCSHVGLTDLVGTASIKTGVMPVPAELPAITIRQITGNQYNTLGMFEDEYLVTHRIQVTVFAKDTNGVSGYAKVKQILAQVRAACPQTRGMVNGFNSDSIYPDIEGPDIFDATSLITSQSQDYMVSFLR